MWTRQQIAYVATALLFLSLFMPLISVPIMGSVTFIRFARGLPGLAMLMSVALAFLFTVRRSYRFLLAPGVLSLCSLGYVFWGFQELRESIGTTRNTQPTDDSFLRSLDAVTQGLSEAIQIQWGFGVALLGAVMLLAIAVSRQRVDVPAEVPPPRLTS